jgi:hypothetical protein
MHTRPLLAIISSVALITGGCSSRPRYFVATLNPPAADQVIFEKDMATCRILVGRGYKSNFGAAAASLGAGSAAGIATTAASIAAVDGGLIFGTATTASNVLAIAVLPVGILAGFGVSRAIRSGREKKVKTALTSCLSEYGHKVDEWTPAKRPKIAKPNPEASPAVTP